jgi:hypothetical protein
LNFIFLVYHICTPTILGYVCFNLNTFEILIDFISCYSRKYILNLSRLQKIKKLNHFLGGDKINTVNPDEVVLLRLQLKYMKLYANTLNLRIAGTKGE